MRRHRHLLGFLLCAAAAITGGCRRNIVLAGPPVSVATPPPAVPPTPPAVSTPPAAAGNTATLPTETPAEAAAPTLEPAISPAPARPRPVPVEPEPVKPKPEADAVPAPQIAPQLSAQQLAETQRATNEEIRVAESNLQLAAGQKLNASQTDLLDKIRAFLDQAHDAIKASDWVRAENLAQKAEILSVELKNSF